MLFCIFNRPGIAFLLEKASLTIEDVTKQKKIEIRDEKKDHWTLMSITYFVPYCRFPTPKAGISSCATIKAAQSLYLL